MTQLLDKGVAPAVVPVDLLDHYARTIASYDLAAAEHAERLAQADFGDYLRQFTAALPPGAVVLDGGCGAGRDLAWLSAHGYRPIGLDLSTGMLAHATAAAPMAGLVRGDLRSIPLSDATVDGVWLCASLLHLAPLDAATALREVARVLRPGGTIFLSTAAGRGSYWRRSGLGPRWFQLYEEADLVEIVTEAGLGVVSSSTDPGVVMGHWVNVTAQKPV